MMNTETPISSRKRRKPNSTERSRKFREKLTPEAKAARQAQNTKYQREKRAKLSHVQKVAETNATRLRMKKLRVKRSANFKPQKTQELDNFQILSHTAFTNRQAKSRAARKMERSFPDSPNKTNELLIEACAKRGIPVLRRLSKQSAKLTSDETVKAVKDFYLRDDISRMAPGKKDCIFLKDTTGKYIRNEDGSKKSDQIRHLMYTTRETFFLFKQEFPLVKIGKSKFSELRPQQVLLISEHPENVCMCVYHANMKLLVQSLQINDMPDEYGLIAVVVCNKENEKCMNLLCASCGIDNLDDFVEQHRLDLEEDVEWYQWEKDAEEKMVKARKEGIKEDVINLIKNKAAKFLAHHLTKAEQSKHFQILLKQNSSTNGLLQIDFSENYSIKHQDTIQSAYWGMDQITIYTAVAWIGKTTLDYVIVSDYLHHDKFAAFIFNNCIIADIKKRNPLMKHLDIFSDGAAQHFKQRYTLSTINHIANQHQLNSVNWNFFATSHGKCAVDGIGGTLKRIVWNRVRAKTDVVISSQDFVKVASQHTFIPIIHISKEDIEARKPELQEMWRDIKPFPKIHEIHCVRANSASGTNVVIANLSKQKGESFNFSG